MGNYNTIGGNYMGLSDKIKKHLPGHLLPGAGGVGVQNRAALPAGLPGIAQLGPLEAVDAEGNTTRLCSALLHLP